MVGIPRMRASGSNKEPDEKTLKLLKKTVENAVQTAIAGNPELQSFAKDGFKAITGGSELAGELKRLLNSAEASRRALSCLRWVFQVVELRLPEHKREYSKRVLEKRDVLTQMAEALDAKDTPGVWLALANKVIDGAPKDAGVSDVALILCAAYELENKLDPDHLEHQRREDS